MSNILQNPRSVEKATTTSIMHTTRFLPSTLLVSTAPFIAWVASLTLCYTHADLPVMLLTRAVVNGFRTCNSELSALKRWKTISEEKWVDCSIFGPLSLFRLLCFRLSLLHQMSSFNETEGQPSKYTFF